jgi:hypothetical protein
MATFDGQTVVQIHVSNRYLARLRLARVRCNENIARLESMLAFQRSRREAIEAAIHDLEPELKLPPPTRRPNPVFQRGEIRRIMLKVMREAGEPLASHQIAARILAEKGIPTPSRTLYKMTRSRVRAALLALGKRGVARVVGVGDERRRELVSLGAADNAPESDKLLSRKAL